MQRYTYLKFIKSFVGMHFVPIPTKQMSLTTSMYNQAPPESKQYLSGQH